MIDYKVLSEIREIFRNAFVNLNAALKITDLEKCAELIYQAMNQPYRRFHNTQHVL